MTIAELTRLGQPDDIEEAIARLAIDGLAVRFGEWVKASEPAARYEQLARYAASANGSVPSRMA